MLERKHFVLLLLLMNPISESWASDQYRCRVVGSDWVWFSDHVALSVSYIAIGPPKRKFKVGTGVSISGSPWGWRGSYVQKAEFSGWGAGAVHIKKDDSGEPFKVCVSSNGITAIPIIDREF